MYICTKYLKLFKMAMIFIHQNYHHVTCTFIFLNYSVYGSLVTTTFATLLSIIFVQGDHCISDDITVKKLVLVAEEFGRLLHYYKGKKVILICAKHQ